jgi:hypothetical protein
VGLNSLDSTAGHQGEDVQFSENLSVAGAEEGDRAGLEDLEEGRVARKRCEATTAVVRLRGLDMEVGSSGIGLWGSHMRIEDWRCRYCDGHLLGHSEMCFRF